MTIDERLERLTERHEALAQSVELLAHTVHELTDDLKIQKATAESHEQQIQALAEATKALLAVAQVHQNRLDKIEGK